MRYLCLCVLLAAVGCARPPQETEAPLSAAAIEARIGQIPAADPSKYAGMKDMKNWQNPYLIVNSDGVALLDAADHEERQLKLEELTQALAKLPATSWPYGRVVVVTESGTQSGDVSALRRNRGIVAGTLESLHILINWVPSA